MTSAYFCVSFAYLKGLNHQDAELDQKGVVFQDFKANQRQTSEESTGTNVSDAQTHCDSAGVGRSCDIWRNYMSLSSLSLSLSLSSHDLCMYLQRNRRMCYGMLWLCLKTIAYYFSVNIFRILSSDTASMFVSIQIGATLCIDDFLEADLPSPFFCTAKARQIRPIQASWPTSQTFASWEHRWSSTPRQMRPVTGDPPWSAMTPCRIWVPWQSRRLPS